MTALAQAIPNQMISNEAVVTAQATFRAVMNATARPGSIQAFHHAPSAPEPLSPGAAALALALFDHDTPVWLDAALSEKLAVADWLRFQTGAPVTADPMEAAFALVSDTANLPPLHLFNPGTPEYPDRSTTLILQVETFAAGSRIALMGPGIRGRQLLQAAPLPGELPAQLTLNRGLFPRGVDLLLVSSDGVAAIPRSVRLMTGEG
jgi:alpha-D-ribose 1-methylphosphonate 5-triphosphate synthase subunit PhnH